MDELIRQMGLSETSSSVVTIWQILFGVVVSALLSLAVSWTYRRVQSEASYSQALAHSFVVVAMVTALIMVIIGSNIARAFSLVGALSIIRFRTAIKSPLDVAFVFLAIAVGMACGTGFLWQAAVADVVILAVVLLLVQTNAGAKPPRTEFLLSVCFHPDVDYEAALDPLLKQSFDAYSLAYVETIRQGTQREVVYSVRPRPGVPERGIIDAVAGINGNLKVSYRAVRSAVEVP